PAEAAPAPPEQRHLEGHAGTSGAEASQLEGRRSRSSARRRGCQEAEAETHNEEVGEVSLFEPTHRWGPHLAGLRNLDDVADVEWARTKAVRIATKECALDRGLLVVCGPVGVGKTFSVARAA